MKEIIKGAFLIFVFKIFGAVSMLALHLVIAREYGAETLGVFNLIFSLLFFVTIFSKLGLDTYVIRKIPEIQLDKSYTSSFISKILRMLLISGLVSSVVLLFSTSWIDSLFFKNTDAKQYLLFGSFIIIPFTFFNALPEIFRGFYDIKIYSFFRNVSLNLGMIISLGASLFLFNYKIDIIYLFFAIIIIASILMFITLVRFLKSKSITLFKNEPFKDKILKYSYPMLFTSSIMFVMGNLDSFMISYYIDEEHVGLYSACIKLSIGISFILSSINGFIAPKIAKAHSDNNKTEIKRIYYSSIKLISIGSLPIVVLLVLFPSLFLSIFGEEFKIAATPLVILTIASGVNALFGSVGYLLNMTDNQNIFMKFLFLGLIVNLCLNLLLIPNFGITGAAIATASSMIFWNVSLFTIAKKKLII